jgi:hypothetical protein
MDDAILKCILCYVILSKCMCCRLTANSVFILRNYVVKAARYQLLSTPKLRKIDEPFFDIEIDVNNRNPIGEVQIVEPSAIARCRHVPDLKFSFYTRKQLR